jgi:tripartite-type tricarboxylate transporter receptor subunit TctC
MKRMASGASALMCALTTAAVVAETVVIALPAVAQTYPSRPIRLVVPWAPGGNVDITARIVGQSLTEQMGQTVVVDNRAGGGGTVGANLVAKAAPDGYTLVMGSSGSITVSPAVYRDVPYDPAKDFTAISMVHIVPMVVLASPKTPVSNVQELLALAKARPGKVTMASAGTGSSNHLVIELINTMGHVRFLHVPYKGSGPALAELLGGQVETMVDQLNSSIGFVREGKLKAIAVTTKTRSSALPAVPTLDEGGLKGFDANTWTGVLAPRALPQAVADRLRNAVVAAVRSASVAEKLKGIGADPTAVAGAEFAAFIRNDHAKWKQVAQAAHVQVD